MADEKILDSIRDGDLSVDNITFLKEHLNDWTESRIINSNKIIYSIENLKILVDRCGFDINKIEYVNLRYIFCGEDLDLMEYILRSGYKLKSGNTIMTANEKDILSLVDDLSHWVGVTDGKAIEIDERAGGWGESYNLYDTQNIINIICKIRNK